MKIYCASTIWGMFLPATVAADAIRAVSMTHAGVDSHEVIASIIIERTIGFLAVLLLGNASLLLFSMSGSFENHFTVGVVDSADNDRLRHGCADGVVQ